MQFNWDGSECGINRISDFEFQKSIHQEQGGQLCHALSRLAKAGMNKNGARRLHFVSRRAKQAELNHSAEVTLIFFGCTASRFGMITSSTPCFDDAEIASAFAVSGKLKRR